MNNPLKEFVNGIGALTEIWTMVYQNFIKQGYTASDALLHTKEFASVLFTYVMNYTNNKEETND